MEVGTINCIQDIKVCPFSGDKNSTSPPPLGCQMPNRVRRYTTKAQTNGMQTHLKNVLSPPRPSSEERELIGRSVAPQFAQPTNQPTRLAYVPCGSFHALRTAGGVETSPGIRRSSTSWFTMHTGAALLSGVLVDLCVVQGVVAACASTFVIP